MSCLLLLPVACGQDPLKALFQTGSCWTLCEGQRCDGDVVTGDRLPVGSLACKL